MSLIQGMEDVITHIKNQELRIEKLERENKQLKEKNEKLKELVGSIKKETDKAK